MDIPAMMELQKYRFWRALRPFSFGVALATCLIGLTAAWHEGRLIPLNAVLVLLGGLLLQAGVNLINDYSDIEWLEAGPEAELAVQRIRRNFIIGLLCFLLAAVLGFYLVATRSFDLLWLFLLGLAGALGYTLKPVNYKSRGLGVVLVFWLMGVLMVAGAYVAGGGALNGRILLLSVPISVLVSLLLLSNELRDFEADRRQGLLTLTARAGYCFGAWLYRALLLACVLSVVALATMDMLQRPWLMVIALPFMLWPLRYLGLPAAKRRPLTPATGRLVMVFGILFCLSIA